MAGVQHNAIVMNPGSRRAKHRRMYQYEVLITLTDQQIEVFSVNLTNVLGPSSVTSCRDWFDEFRIARFKLVATGVNYALKGVGVSGTPTISSCAEYDSSSPTNRAELLRMKGCRTQPLDFGNGTLLLAVVNKPTFDETGSDNHYVTGWLMTGQATAQNTAWRGAILGLGYQQQPGFSAALTCNCAVTVDFRGFQ